MEYYAPEFKLHVPVSNMENDNPREYLDKTMAKIFECLSQLKAITRKLSMYATCLSSGDMNCGVPCFSAPGSCSIMGNLPRRDVLKVGGGSTSASLLLLPCERAFLCH